MDRIRRHLVHVSLFATLALWAPSAAGGAATADEALRQTINHLLQYVEESKCVFLRNDKEYNSQEAAKHIRSKYDSYIFSIKTPEEFIEAAASKSILSGKPYFVRCVDHPSTTSADWLTKELSQYRSKRSP